MGTGRRRPSAGTVIGVIALVVAFGGAAYADNKGPSVGTVDLKTGAVTAPKIHSDAVRTAKIGDDAVTGAKVNESTLGPVPLANHALNILAVTVRSDGTLARASQQGSTSAQKRSRLLHGRLRGRRPRNVRRLAGRPRGRTDGQHQHRR